MKIVIDDCYKKDVTIEEILEPTGSCLLIKQGDNVIELTTEYMTKLLAKSLNFMLNMYKEKYNDDK